jgi:hypothetical protein
MRRSQNKEVLEDAVSHDSHVRPPCPLLFSLTANPAAWQLWVMPVGEEFKPIRSSSFPSLAHSPVMDSHFPGFAHSHFPGSCSLETEAGAIQEWFA